MMTKSNIKYTLILITAVIGSTGVFCLLSQTTLLIQILGCLVFLGVLGGSHFLEVTDIPTQYMVNSEMVLGTKKVSTKDYYEHFGIPTDEEILCQEYKNRPRNHEKEVHHSSNINGNNTNVFEAKKPF